MDITKFDFTKFTKEKWQNVINKVAGDYNTVTGVETSWDLIKGELIPSVKVEYVYETEVDGEEEYSLTFEAFIVRELPAERATKTWRRIMLKEFKDVYYNSLTNYISLVREQKHQKVDEDCESELRDIHNALYY